MKTAQSGQNGLAETDSAIVYFGNDWSGENRTSSHHIAQQLSKTHEVIYIECPGLRAPSGSTRDVRKLFRKLSKLVSPPKQVSPSLAVHTLIQLPFHRFGTIRRFNRWLTRVQVRRILRSRGAREFVSWFTVPHVASVARAIGERFVVYYCIDDYASLPNVEADAIKKMDEELTRLADIVFVASATLLDAKKRLNQRTFVNPHGVDTEHFQIAQVAGEIPADIAALSRPIVGFFGLIEAWINLDLIEYVARRRPNWTFAMIGRAAVQHAGVTGCKNVVFLGAKPYALLPAYGRVFDVAVIPYHLTQQVLHANPLKLREYLAMGKPVVSVRTPEIDRFADVVRIADTPEEFLNHLDAVLAKPDSTFEIERRMERVAESSWASRVGTALTRIKESVCVDPPGQDEMQSGSLVPCARA
jgi:glycosyltransferase involved in cell wall biosynthesis